MATPQIAADKSADAHFPASQILMITPLFYVLCEWFAAAWSAAQSFKNGSILTCPYECTGLKTLIYGTAAGIDPHRINRSKLLPWYIAGPCYRSPPVNFPHSPQGQHSVMLDKVAEQLSCYRLPTSHPALQPTCLQLSAPVLQSRLRYSNDFNHLPAAPQGLEGKEHVDNTKWLESRRYKV